MKTLLVLVHLVGLLAFPLLVGFFFAWAGLPLLASVLLGLLFGSLVYRLIVGLIVVAYFHKVGVRYGF